MDEKTTFQRSKNLTNISLTDGNVNIYMQGTVNERCVDIVAEEPTEARKNLENHTKILGTYIKKAIEYCSTKKTLLYAEQPHSFYDIYVCNNLAYYNSQIPATQSSKSYNYNKIKEVIENATPQILGEKSEYIIISGTGGIGKSMFLTHMFLSSASEYSKEYSKEKKLPIFVTLKDYCDTMPDLVSFIWKAVKAFAPKISMSDITQELENQKVLLMLDGLDELQSSLREKFNADLEDFIKAYSGNNILMTSRQTKSLGSFVSFTRFSVFSIEPLTKKQALTLIRKLVYRDEEAKKNFIKDLDKHLYEDHKEFASNPLLLTIMLLAYTDFGEVPAKMHVFYKKAYETMAREHDATKGSFKRPFQTKLTPEELARFFAEFCMITYEEEKIEFSGREFASYMDEVLEGSEAKANGVTSHDFLTDLTDHLCIMYKEGEKYHFIHKSFQEYFTAYYLANNYDGDLKDVGDFFENADTENSITFSDSDKTFDMLCDMIPERVERHIFLPYLDKLLAHCEGLGELEGYWEFLERQYAVLIYNEGMTGDTYKTEAKSFLYKAIINVKNLRSHKGLDVLPWPDQVRNFSAECWFMSYASLDEPYLDDLERTKWGSVYRFSDHAVVFVHDFFEQPITDGHTYFINIKEIRENPLKFMEIQRFMEDSSFPLMEEYNNIRRYHTELQARIQKKLQAKRLSRK